jgi:hypothetical protein
MPTRSSATGEFARKPNGGLIANSQSFGKYALCGRYVARALAGEKPAD